MRRLVRGAASLESYRLQTYGLHSHLWVVGGGLEACPTLGYDGLWGGWILGVCSAMAEASLPAPELSDELARWLAPARGRLLRRLQIARRRRVLDVACGTGAVTAELVRSIRGYPILRGVRGEPGVDLDSLAEVVERLSHLAADFPAIAELDINPLLCYPDRVVAVDLRLTVTGEEGS
ncbi:TPA: hypothetical protein EYP84_02055 [Candidatus Bipolaricaulota bacterium]|nr:hypothetical protein [Candidatus Bipolaricaulota bacterium]